MGQSIQARSRRKTRLDTGMVFKYGLMERNMKATLRTTLLVEPVCILLLKETFIKAIFKTGRLMELES